MKAVLMSINSLHNINIESGLKGSELRTRPPKLEPPFKVYTYESGALGRHKVVNEWICRSMTTWKMYMGIPAHLSKVACVSNEYISKYSGKGYKDITEMKISDLVIYDKPKELSEFYIVDEKAVKQCEHRERIYQNPIFTNGAWLLGSYICNKDEPNWCKKCKTKPLIRPPQSWCYVEELESDKQ